MVEFIIGGAGCGKSTLMFERIKSCADAPKGQVILVPEQYSYEFDRNLYYYLGAEKFNNLISQSFKGLSRQLFQDYGDTDRKGEYADEYDTMVLIYQAVFSAQKNPDALSFFRKQSGKNGFAEEVLKIIDDLKRSGISSEKLMEKADLISGSRLGDKARDIAFLYYEYERIMHEYGFKDSRDNIREAAKTANLHQYFSGRNVYIDEFDSFQEDQIDMIKVIVSSAENVVFTLKTEDIECSDFTLFETVNRTFRKLKAVCAEMHREYKVTVCSGAKRFKYKDLAYLSSRIMRNMPHEPEKAPISENIQIFEAKDMYSETEYVCATIKRLIHNDKTLRYRDIAVIANDITPYSEILRAAYERYEIPYFLSVEKSVSHTSVMVFFNSLLDFLSARKIRSEQIFRLIKCNLMDISDKPESALTDGAILENYCYKWGVEGDMWLSEFTASDDNLGEIEKMRIRIINPLTELKRKINHEKKAAGICRLLYNYLIECQAEKNTGILMGQLIDSNKDYEAAELKRLWACLMNILDSIVKTLGDRETSFSEVKRIIKSMTASLKYSVPPQTTDSIITASARNARLNEPRIVFVLGACEGDFPNKVSLHGLLSASDKQVLADMKLEITRPLSDLIADERLIVYKSFSTASEKLYISYPLSDLSGQAKYRSQCVEQVMDIFGNRKMLKTEGEIPSHYYAVTGHSAYYRYMQDIRKNDESIASIKYVLEKQEEFRSKIERVRRKSDFTQDFQIDKEIMQKLKSFEPLYLSATALEKFSECHFMYFCDYFLKLKSNEKIDLDARIKGDLIHNCYCDIIGTRTKEQFTEMSEEEMVSEIRKCADSYKAEKLAGNFGKTPKFDLMYNKLTDRIIHAFRHTKEEFIESQFRTAECEFEIVNDKKLKLYFGDGKSIIFDGKIDRIDTCEIDGEKYVRIVDYKSSPKEIDEKTLASGKNLQMLLYLFTITENGAKYSNYNPAGVLYSPMQIKNITAESEVKTDDDFNQQLIDSSFKNKGLVLGRKDVILAMEKEGLGKYIPAKIKNNRIDEKSSCISMDGMEELKEYTYGKLINMAQTLIEGNVNAEPLKIEKKLPCEYCKFGNICDNSNGNVYCETDISEIEKAEEILSKKTEKGDDENELD